MTLTSSQRARKRLMVDFYHQPNVSHNHATAYTENLISIYRVCFFPDTSFRIDSFLSGVKTISMFLLRIEIEKHSAEKGHYLFRFHFVFIKIICFWFFEKSLFVFFSLSLYLKLLSILCVFFVENIFVQTRLFSCLDKREK